MILLLRFFSFSAIFLFIGFPTIWSQANNLCLNSNFKTEIDSYLSDAVPIISVEEAYNERSSIIFLDAREPEEYKVSHLPNAIQIGYEDFSFDKIHSLDRKSAIVVYCSIGYRSEIIAKKMIDNGFTNVKNLYGSIFEWVNQGHSVFKESHKKTDQVHTYNKEWSKWLENQSINKVW